MSDLDMAQVYSLISMIGFIAAAGCTVVAVILWFRFRIPEVIRYLTGKSARVSIEKKRSENASKNQGGYHFRMRVGEGATSEQIQVRKSTEAEETAPNQGLGGDATLPLGNADAVSAQGMENEFETVSLEQSMMAVEQETERMSAQSSKMTGMPKEAAGAEMETAPLSRVGMEETETEPLNQVGTEETETVPLNQAGMGETETVSLKTDTVPLRQETEVLETERIGADAARTDKKLGVSFHMVQDIVLVHTDEQIADI